MVRFLSNKLNLSKKSFIGIASLFLVLIIILFFNKSFFHILIGTTFGRILLIFLLILFAYIHHLLGILFLLTLIVAFQIYRSNLNQYSYEGLETINTDSTTTPTTTTSSSLTNPILQQIQNKRMQLNNLVKTNLQTDSTIPSTSTPSNTTSTSTSTTNTNTNTDINTTPTTSLEGFCMCDKERAIQTGKQSNSINILNTSRIQSGDVKPSTSDVFSLNYSIYK